MKFLMFFVSPYNNSSCYKKSYMHEKFVSIPADNKCLLRQKIHKKIKIIFNTVNKIASVGLYVAEIIDIIKLKVAAGADLHDNTVLQVPKFDHIFP